MPTFDTLQDAIDAGYVRVFTKEDFYKYAKDVVNVRIISDGTVVIMIMKEGM